MVLHAKYAKIAKKIIFSAVLGAFFVVLCG